MGDLIGQVTGAGGEGTKTRTRSKGREEKHQAVKSLSLGRDQLSVMREGEARGVMRRQGSTGARKAGDEQAPAADIVSLEEGTLAPKETVVGVRMTTGSVSGTRSRGGSPQRGSMTALPTGRLATALCALGLIAVVACVVAYAAGMQGVPLAGGLQTIASRPWTWGGAGGVPGEQGAKGAGAMAAVETPSANDSEHARGAEGLESTTGDGRDCPPPDLFRPSAARLVCKLLPCVSPYGFCTGLNHLTFALSGQSRLRWGSMSWRRLSAWCRWEGQRQPL